MSSQSRMRDARWTDRPCRALRARRTLLVFIFTWSIASCGEDPSATEDAGSDASVDEGGVLPPGSDAGGNPDGGGSCNAGEVDCACAPGASCEPGLRCNAGRCAVCPAGESGCPCTGGQRCDYGLVCLEGTCAAEDCVAGTEGCPCSGGSCGEGLGCGSDNLCRLCRADIAGCPCIGGSCSLALLCDDSNGLCRAPVRCSELATRGECIPHQACIEGSGVDARCVPEACEAGYRWDTDSGSCVSCPECVTGRSCLAGAAGIGDECATAFRSCIELDGFATCGDCAPGVDEVEGACLPKNRCGDEVCTSEQYCDRLAETCRALPCSNGQAKRADTNAQCTACSNSCAGVGFTGRYWPFRTKTDRCVCETYPGYFAEAAGFAAQPCDADHDGWVRKEADDGAIREDEALLQNARCEILRVGRVIMRDEYGQQLSLDSCRDEGYVETNSGDSCSEPFPLRLLESSRNDVPGAVTSLQTPKYGVGTAGRRLTGPELNGLSKACVNDLGDFDADGVEDLNQVQPGDFAAATPDDERLAAFSYFVELYRSSYVEPNEQQDFGSLLIEERSRCDAERFPFHYSEGDGYGAGGPSAPDPGYWRNCSRLRDARFDADEAGFDFARWTCDSLSGTCAGAMPGPAHASLDYASVDPKHTLLREHGLCELKGQAPKDQRFRGLGHSSQFRCMRVSDFPASPNEATLSAFAPGGSWTFNACSAVVCSGTQAGCVQSEAVGDGGFQPRLDCAPILPERNQVGFALRNYQPYGTGPLYANIQPPVPTSYQGGCVNEDSEYGQKLCPTPEFVRGYELLSFGRYSCFGDKSRWQWCGPPASANRATLYWARSRTSQPANMSTWSYQE